MVTAPFHRVGFADFWLADQLNSLVVVLMDLEYMICFYSMELNWTKSEGELWIKDGIQMHINVLTYSIILLLDS